MGGGEFKFGGECRGIGEGNDEFTSVPDLPVSLRRGCPPVLAETSSGPTTLLGQRLFHQKSRELLRDLLGRES